MNESRLTPFDSETFIMIESITGKYVEVIPNYFSYTLTAYTSKLDDDKIESLINSVSGRLGKRLSKIDKRAYCVIFSVWYQKTTYDLPFEYSKEYTKPDETAGEIYCRRLLEVRALPVKRDNLEKLLMFTGGGTMQIPRTPGGLAVYSFQTENGVMLDVPEENYIVLTPDGKFGKMDMQTFMANFEEKDANTAGLTFDEKRLFEKMNKLFGKNFQMRFLKLTEEYHELFVVADDMLVNGIIPENTSEIIDELADLNAVLFHIAALFGYSQKELQEMAYKKIAGREKNPDFMRKHPHTEPGKYVCENCNKFEIRDGDDGGFCKEQKKMKHRNCLSCNQWQERQTAEEYKHFDERFNKRL